MQTVAFHTVGCKVNQYDTQRIRARLLEKGFRETDFSEGADVVIINTCSVTLTAEAKCRKAISRARRLNPAARIIVTGCYANRDAELLLTLDHVDDIVLNEQKHKIAEMVSKDASLNVHDACVPGHRTRALLKIQDGCDNFCTYCIVPYLRGPSRSRASGEILEEAAQLGRAGYKEIVITGIHLGQFGLTGKDISFPELLQEISVIKGIERIRLSSIDSYDLSDESIEQLSKIDKLCEHFHMPLQSGDDRVLSAMKRRYDTLLFKSRVESLRNAFDQPGITTDIIVGFPGETDREFENTLAFVEETGFSRIHIFTYSDRPGTLANEIESKVKPEKARKRYSRLEKVAEANALKFAESFCKQEVEVLVESVSGSVLKGYSRRYIQSTLKGQVEKGEIVRMLAEEADSKGLSGALLNSENICR